MKSADVWEHLKEYILTSGVLDGLWESYARHVYNKKLGRYEFDSKEFYKEQAFKALNKVKKPWTRISQKKIENRIVREMMVMAWGDYAKINGKVWANRSVIPVGITFEITEENGEVIDIKTLKGWPYNRTPYEVS